MELSKQAMEKSVSKLDELIQDRYVENLENYYIPIMQDLILREYDVELTGRVTDRRSRTNPMFYRDEFEQALMDFEWIDVDVGKTTLMVPETETFNWRQGRLTVIENIVEGVIGRFMEVNGEQYVAMYGKNPAIQPFDKTVPRKQRVYTIRITIDGQRRWNTAYAKQGIVEYPFSNQPPVNLFDTANTYADENISKWIEEAIKEVKREITR